MDSLLLEALQTARRAAEAASVVHREHSSRISVTDAHEKGRSDYVSEVDLEAEEASRSVIAHRFPEHRFLAEETTESDSITDRSLEGYVWIIDPLDGTANYLHGHASYAASVALAVDGQPVVGVVSAAHTGESWWAVRGGGAFKGGRPIRVSSLPGIEHALVGTGFPFKRDALIDDYTAQLGRVLRATAGVRRAGAAALDLCLLAEGVFDAFWELHLNPWDYAAGMLVVEEAGGVCSRVEGGALRLTPGTVMAANSPDTLSRLAGVLS